MNRYFFLFLLLTVVLCAGQSAASPAVRWVEYSQALQRSAQDKKPVFIEFHADWCVPCHVMERTTFRDSTVVKLLNSKFHAVRIDVDQTGKMRCENQLQSIETCVNETWEIQGIPAFATVDSKGRLQHAFLGAYMVDDFILMLRSLLDKENP